MSDYVGGAYEIRREPGKTDAVTKYYQAFGRVIAMRGQGGVKWLLADHLGSSTGVLDTGGRLIGHAFYWPYGTMMEDSQTGSLDKLYTGQQRESASPWGEGNEIYYYHARFYDAGVGRMLQADLMIGSPFSARSLDRYTYVLGSPLGYTDPTGNCAYGYDCGEGDPMIWLMCAAGNCGPWLDRYPVDPVFGLPTGLTDIDIVIQFAIDSVNTIDFAYNFAFWGFDVFGPNQDSFWAGVAQSAILTALDEAIGLEHLTKMDLEVLMFFAGNYDRLSPDLQDRLSLQLAVASIMPECGNYDHMALARHMGNLALGAMESGARLSWNDPLGAMLAAFKAIDDAGEVLYWLGGVIITDLSCFVPGFS